MGDPVIRAAAPRDAAALRRGIIELQEYERRLHPSRRPGVEMAAAYHRWLRRHAERDGAILVAEIGGEFGGFVAGWVRQQISIAETPESNRFGYISDLCVMPGHRRRGLATLLLDALERRFAAAGVRRVLLSALAGNSAARAVYERAGFIPYEIAYEKSIGAPDRIAR